MMSQLCSFDKCRWGLGSFVSQYCKKFNSVVHPPLSIRAYEIERRVKTPEKYLFPCYETVNWYAAKHILDILKGEKQYVRLFAELVLMPSW